MLYLHCDCSLHLYNLGRERERGRGEEREGERDKMRDRVKCCNQLLTNLLRQSLLAFLLLQALCIATAVLVSLLSSNNWLQRYDTYAITS